MRGWIGRRFQLVVWCLSGVTADAVVLTAIWLALNAAGPLVSLRQSWLVAVGFATTPLIVHAAILPAIFCRTARSWSTVLRAIVLTPSFMIATAILIPLVGFAVFVAITAFKTTLQSLDAAIASLSHNTVVNVSGDLALTVIAVCVAVIVGLLLHAMRTNLSRNGDEPQWSHPCMRSDVAGAAIAAGITFGGSFVAQRLGLFTRMVSMQDGIPSHFAAVARPSAILLIGVVALFPHLLLVGCEHIGRRPFVLERQGHTAKAK